MKRCCAQRKPIALLAQHADDFGRKAREGGQRAQKAGHQGQPPYRIQRGKRLKHRHAHTDQIAAYEVGGQGATGKEMACNVGGTMKICADMLELMLGAGQ